MSSKAKRADDEESEEDDDFDGENSDGDGDDDGEGKAGSGSGSDDGSSDDDDDDESDDDGAKRKRKKNDDESEDGNLIPVDDSELKNLDSAQVIPRAKRRAALASGLVAKASAKKPTKVNKQGKDDDDEAEFEF